MAEEIEDFLKDIDDSVSIKTQEQDEDDEFERLLQDFINNELTEDDQATTTNDEKESLADKKPASSSIASEDEFIRNLYNEERALYNAHNNFAVAISDMAGNGGFSMPNFGFNSKMIYPRYKLSVGIALAKDTMIGWDVMIKAHPNRIVNIRPDAKDEELLEFAEKTTDDNLQMALISYVEILIELESCEISYEKRRLKAKRRRIEKEVYEEHQQRLERIQKYISAVKAQNFPIDAERLVVNYFKTARKDADGAYKMLTSNPATFAPIIISKIKARFFGMIKSKPEDGIRINQELGKFLKNLKV